MPRPQRILTLVLAVALFATACNQGHVNIYAFAKRGFDPYTGADADWEWMGDNYDAMVVFEPYWDSRLDDYDDALVYRNAYGINVDTTKDRRAADHPDWILRQANGDEAYIPFACGGSGCVRYAADVGNPAYVADWIARVQDAVDRGYRGLYIDDVNLVWRFSDRNGNDVRPIDPRTGEEMRMWDWRTYMVEFLEAVRAEFPEIEIWHNSLWFTETPDFDHPLVNRQILAADRIQLERGFNDRGLTSGSGRFGLETFMGYIDHVHSLGRNVALLDTEATTNAEQWFNIGGYLLVNDGGDLVSTDNWDHIAPGSLFWGFHTDLGSARGDREVTGDIIRREFDGGLVVLNQSRSTRRTVQLGGTYVTPGGQTVTSIMLDPRRAIVLRRP